MILQNVFLMTKPNRKMKKRIWSGPCPYGEPYITKHHPMDYVSNLVEENSCHLERNG